MDTKIFELLDKLTIISRLLVTIVEDLEKIVIKEFPELEVKK